MRALVEKNRIIHALDIDNENKVLQIAEAVKNYVDAIKLSYPLILKNGVGIVSRVKEISGLPVIVCFKIADIPEMNRMIMKSAVDADADGVTVHGFVGRDSVKACVEVGNKGGTHVFVVTEMSHPGALEFLQPLGEKIASMAKDVGASGIVAPATRPERVRRYRQLIGEEMFIISPGVGPQGGRLGDAILGGANFEIVGRSIYDSPNPADAASRMSLQLRERLRAHT